MMVQAARKPPPGWALILVVVVFAGVAVTFLTLGIWGFGHVRHEQSLLTPIPGGSVTTGKVVDSQEYCFRGCTYAPAIRYTDEHGIVHTFTAPPQNNYPPVGSKVQVSYNPHVPGEAHDITNGPSSWSLELAMAVLAICVGGLFVLMGCFVAIRAWRSHQAASVRST
jgi:hypothetical protein